MARYTYRRLLEALVTLFILTIVVFFLTSIIGDPVGQIVPPDASREEYERVQALLGFDKPLYEQYFNFVGGLFRGDLGMSLTRNRPASELIAARLPITLKLAIGSVVIAMVVGIPLGVLAGVRPNSIVDRLSVVLATLGHVIPTFLIAMIGIAIFSVTLGWLPVRGGNTLLGWILPMGSLVVWSLAAITRLTRSGVQESMHQPFVSMARAKGLSDNRVVLRHAVRPAMMPVLTYGGLQLGVLLSGAVIVETMFAMPGLGDLAIQSVRDRDVHVVRAIVMFSGLAFLLVNLLVDLSYSLVDPRVRYEAKK